jgi:thioredoxin-related protein
MGISSARRGFGTVAITAAITVLLAVQACAETSSTEPAAKDEPTSAESTSPAVTAQTVSSPLPAKKNRELFQHSSYPKAWTAAQQSNRPILLYVTMPGCSHCDKMMEETLHLPHVKQMISESFETVYVSRRTHAKLVKKLKVKWYPTTVLVGSNNKVVDLIEGYVDAKVFQSRLKVGLASADSPTQTR